MKTPFEAEQQATGPLWCLTAKVCVCTGLCQLAELLGQICFQRDGAPLHLACLEVPDKRGLVPRPTRTPAGCPPQSAAVDVVILARERQGRNYIPGVQPEAHQDYFST